MQHVMFHVVLEQLVSFFLSIHFSVSVSVYDQTRTDKITLLADYLFIESGYPIFLLFIFHTRVQPEMALIKHGTIVKPETRVV